MYLEHRLSAMPQPHLHSPLTLVSQIVEHTEINERMEEIAENLIVEHLFYTISIATNNRTPGIFFHYVNSQTRLAIGDTWLQWIAQRQPQEETRIIKFWNLVRLILEILRYIQ